jgi:hypothetical protein
VEPNKEPLSSLEPVTPGSKGEDSIKTDFEQFYESSLLPYLDGLKLGASAYRNWKYFTIATVICTVVFFCLFQFFKFQSGALLGGLSLIITLSGVYFFTQKSEKYVDDFKDQIIRKIIFHIDKEAIYKPMHFVSKKEYKASGLFRRRFTEYDGDDYWQSVYRGTSFHCSELMVRYEDSTTATTLFKGLFISIDINPVYAGATYVWMRGDEQLPASVADEEYRMYTLPDVEKYTALTEGFRKVYSVYTTHVSQAQQLISAERQLQMLELKLRTKRDIVFSFVAGKSYVALPFDDDLLEPVKGNLNNKEAYKKYFFTFLLVFNIIKVLDLERLK